MIYLLDYKAILLISSMTFIIIINISFLHLFTTITMKKTECFKKCFERIYNDLNFSTRIIPLIHFRYVVGIGL